MAIDYIIKSRISIRMKKSAILFIRMPKLRCMCRKFNIHRLSSAVLSSIRLIPSCLVGGLEHEFYASIQLGISSSQVTNSYFSEGWLNHQPDASLIPMI